MTPAQAAAALNVKPNTLRKWTNVGIKLKSGKRLVLPCRKIGGRLDVSQEDIDRFCEALTADRCAPAPRPVSERDKRVMASLEARGW